MHTCVVFRRYSISVLYGIPAVSVLFLIFVTKKNCNSCFCKLACICFLNEWTKTNNFMFCWPFISIHLCNKNQPDAQFILSLFHQSASTHFVHICSPSSGVILYIYNNWYALCFSVGCLLTSQQTVNWKAQHVAIVVYIYSIPPDDGLQICPKHVEVDWRNKLRINSASRWFFITWIKLIMFLCKINMSYYYYTSSFAHDISQSTLNV